MSSQVQASKQGREVLAHEDGRSTGLEKYSMQFSRLEVNLLRDGTFIPILKPYRCGFECGGTP